MLDAYLLDIRDLRAHFSSLIARAAPIKEMQARRVIMTEIIPQLYDIDAGLSGIKLKFMAASQTDESKKKFEDSYQELSNNLNKWIEHIEKTLSSGESSQKQMDASATEELRKQRALIEQFKKELNDERETSSADKEALFLSKEPPIASAIESFLDRATALAQQHLPSQGSGAVRPLLQKIAENNLRLGDAKSPFVFTEEHAQYILEKFEAVLSSSIQAPGSLAKMGSVFLATADLSMNQLEDDFKIHPPGEAGSEERQAYRETAAEVMDSLMSTFSANKMLSASVALKRSQVRLVIAIVDEANKFVQEDPEQKELLRKMLQEVFAKLQSPGKMPETYLADMLTNIRKQRFETSVDALEGQLKKSDNPIIQATGRELIGEARRVRESHPGKKTHDLPEYLHDITVLLQKPGNNRPEEQQLHHAISARVKLLAQIKPWWKKFADVFLKIGAAISSVLQRKTSPVESSPSRAEHRPKQHLPDLPQQKKPSTLPPPQKITIF